MEERRAELLGVPYFHVVFTVPARIGAIAYQNKAVIYDLMFKASSQTMLTIAADPKRLGVKIGFTSVLHTWGSAMTHGVSETRTGIIVGMAGSLVLGQHLAATRRCDGALISSPRFSLLMQGNQLRVFLLPQEV
jgi:hypothetical protein